MANNIVGIEKIPNLYPSACSFNGDDKSTAEWFIRVVNPDTNLDTLLIGSVFFHEMAKRVGYVKLEEVDKAKKSLEEELANVTLALINLSDTVNSVRSNFGVLESIDKRIEDLRRVITAAGKVVKQSADKQSSSSDTSADTK